MNRWINSHVEKERMRFGKRSNLNESQRVKMTETNRVFAIYVSKRVGFSLFDAMCSLYNR